ncbi:hypothetical protein AB0M20_11785 [Actinoplanes sp. NPDC051633]|uniref:hypothetical protein n=1 Tax=Actinoplanes sp. NPDC051633 TaxID=3155670 RepID=UPI0034183E18
MRRALLALAVGGALLTISTACDSDPAAPAAAPTNADPTTQATSTAPDFAANTELVCGKVTSIYDDGFDGFNAAMGKMIANKEAEQAPEAKKAQQAAANELKKVGAALKKEVAAAEDPALKKAGETSAAKLTKSAADKKFFDSIKTTADLNKRIEPKILDWMTPVRGFCA